jgi:hypothetical protein
VPPPSPPDPRRPPNARGAVAGSLLVGTIVLCALVGLAIGAVAGAPGPLAIAGVLVGVPIGIAVVARRFRDI